MVIKVWTNFIINIIFPTIHNKKITNKPGYIVILTIIKMQRELLLPIILYRKKN